MLKDTLTEEMKTAMKARAAERLGVIRMMLAAIKNAEIDKGELDDDATIAVLKSERKKMRDAIDQFKSAGRDELVAEETEKLKVMEEFLPEEMSREEIEKIVSQVITEAEDKNFGKIMGQAMAKTKGQADGNLVQEVVKEKLG